MTNKLPPLPKRTYPNDVNLLSFMFQVARNDFTLALFLSQVKYIRDHPDITEEQARKELALITDVPPKLVQ